MIIIYIFSSTNVIYNYCVIAGRMASTFAIFCCILFGPVVPLRKKATSKWLYGS